MIFSLAPNLGRLQATSPCVVQGNVRPRPRAVNNRPAGRPFARSTGQQKHATTLQSHPPWTDTLNSVLGVGNPHLPPPSVSGNTTVSRPTLFTAQGPPEHQRHQTHEQTTSRLAPRALNFDCFLLEKLPRVLPPRGLPYAGDARGGNHGQETRHLWRLCDSDGVLRRHRFACPDFRARRLRIIECVQWRAQQCLWQDREM